MSSFAVPHSVPVARRQLSQRRGTTAAAIVGVAMAILLMLALRAIFAGMEGRLTAYIDGTGADVVVAQQGVTTMHMTQSALPRSAVAATRTTPGVAQAEPILYRAAFLENAGGRRSLVAAVAGGPLPRIIAGRAPRDGEIAIDRAAASALGVAVGSTVRIFGTPLRVSGEVEGTAAISGSFAFLSASTLERILHLRGAVSYLLVRGDSGVSPGVLAARLDSRIPGATATGRPAFAASERRVVSNMTTGLVRAMTLIALVIGVAVAGLVAYGQALSQLRDYGVLRAIGISTLRATALAVNQVAAIVAAGVAIALALLWLMAELLPALSPTLVLAIRWQDVAQAIGFAVVVALAAAALPVLRVARLDPATAFRSAK